MEASRKTKLSLLHKLGYTLTKGTLGNCHRNTIGRMPGDHTSLSLDASLAIPTRVLHFEAFRRPAIPNWPDRFHKPVRPVLADSHARSSASALYAQPSNPVVFWRTTANPSNLMYPPPITTHDSAPTKSRLNLGFEAQLRNRPRLHLSVLATMRPAFDSAGNRVPRTKPTCLLHTWRPHRQRPFALVLHLHQHQSSRNLQLQYLVKSQSTQHCQSLVTPGSDHPLVLEPHRSSISSLMSALTTHTFGNQREKK
jgi:hypothetical protein